MAFKKAFILSTSILSTMQFGVSYAALCETGTISKISAGTVNLGGDIRENRVQACIGTNCYVSHPDSGLNHSAGNALLTLLLYAKSTGTTVKLYTHSTGSNSGCANKEFDEVLLIG